MIHQSTIKKAEEVKAEALKHYEKGNQAKSMAAVYRNHIKNKFGISYRTFITYLTITQA